MLVDISRPSKDLMQTKVNNWTYDERMDYENIGLKKELQITKVEYFLTIKDLHKARDELFLRRAYAKTSEAKLSTTELAIAKRNAYEIKMFEESMQEERRLLSWMEHEFLK